MNERITIKPIYGGYPSKIIASKSGKWSELYALLSQMETNGPWVSFILPTKKEAENCQSAAKNFVNRKSEKGKFFISTQIEPEGLKFRVWIKKSGGER